MSELVRQSSFLLFKGGSRDDMFHPPPPSSFPPVPRFAGAGDRRQGPWTVASAGPAGRPGAVRHPLRGLCQSPFHLDAGQLLRANPLPANRCLPHITSSASNSMRNWPTCTTASRTRNARSPSCWWMKQAGGFIRTRYRGLRRNALDFALGAIAYNFERSLSIKT